MTFLEIVLNNHYTNDCIYNLFQIHYPVIMFKISEGLAAENGARWRHSSQAAVISMLPSNRAYNSITGLVLGRELADLPRRKSVLLDRRRMSMGGGTARDLVERRKIERSMSIVDGIETEAEQWERRQSIKSMTASIEMKRMVRYKTI